MSLKYHSLLVGAVAALAISASASAQFTAAVVPPRVNAKVDTVQKQDSVRRATVALAARVTDMKRWVDSAAGVSILAPDSSALAKTSRTNSGTRTAALKDSVMVKRNERVRADSAASIGTVEVHDSTGLKGDTPAAAGLPAPDTASMLPLLAIAGASTLLAGAALRRS